MLVISVGDGSIAAPRTVSLSVPQDATVNLLNVSGDPLGYFEGGLNDDPTILEVGDSVDLTNSTWMRSQGISDAQLSGGFYGDGPPADAGDGDGGS